MRSDAQMLHRSGIIWPCVNDFSYLSAEGLSRCSMWK